MPLIRCRLSKDGKLIPSTVEFEKGDRIQFKAHQPVHVNKHRSAEEMEAELPFPLKDITIFTQGQRPGLEINIGSDVAILYNPPPPPPGYPKITILVEEGEELAGAAGIS